MQQKRTLELLNLEVIDQFLDVPVFHTEILVAFWPAQRLLFLLLAF